MARVVPPFPPRSVGPKGPEPLTGVPTREPPKGPHQCDGCPGGPLIDGRKLVENDHLARCFIDCCKRAKSEQNPESSKMIGLDEWNDFVRKSRDHGLISEQDVKYFNDAPAAINNGIDICELQRWLLQKIFSGDMQNFEQASEAMRAAIHNMNISISYRGLGTLSQKELYTYQVLLSECEHTVAENLRQTLRRIEKTEQDWAGKEVEGILKEGSGDTARASTMALGSAYLSGSDPGPLPTTPEEFQWTKGPEIERKLRDQRVTSVSFPPREHVLFQTEWGFCRLTGIVAQPQKDAGTEVEVVEIPWDVPAEHAHSVAEECNRMEALKQLALSKYFRAYLGYDFSSYSGVGLHFLPFQHGISLRELVIGAGCLSEGHTLFRYWAREILLGMRDYLYQCCQELTEDLTLDHVRVDQEGLRIFFCDVPFGECRGELQSDVPEYGPRYKWRNGFVPMENRLIQMFGNMMMELLYGQEPPDAPVRNLKELSTGLRSVISLAVNARDTLDFFSLSPGGKPASISQGRVTADGKSAADVQALAGGFVGAGIDEFDAGEEYNLWWLKKATGPLILPNTERTADDFDGGAQLADDWRGVSHQQQCQVQWKPNANLFTTQALLNHPALQRSPSHTVSAVMEAWDVYSRRFFESCSQRGRLEAFLDGAGR